MTLWNIERDGNVAIASYANPPMNYLIGEGVEELTQHANTTFRDPSLRVVILTGGLEDFFITHFSVEELLATAENKDLHPFLDYRMCDRFHTMTHALNSLPIPVICAMSGDTMGGGFETALACDIRIAQQGDFRIGLPEARLGILPGGGGTQRLSRLLGPGRAINMILRGQVFSPDQALAHGMVHEVAGDAKAHAMTIARDLADLSPVSLREIKRCVYEGSVAPLSAALHIEGGAFLETMKTTEARIKMKAYADTAFENRKGFLKDT